MTGGGAVNEHERFEEFERALAMVELRNFPVPVKLRAKWGGGPDVNRDFELVVSMRVKERDTGREIEVTQALDIRRVAPGRLDEDYVLFFVRRAIVDLLAHEVDEALHYRGARVKDPHAAEQPP